MVRIGKKHFISLLISLFYLVLVFTIFRELFHSYFEADEWFHFTHYLPLTKQSDGIIVTLLKTIGDTDPLSRGQHIVPIGEEIFFLNTLFFGTNFTPYAFMSLLLHSINSFLVFIFIKTLLLGITNKKNIILFALLAGVFFALPPISMHAVTWAAFYGQNVLSVTFFLLCILFFKMSFIFENKRFLYLSVLFLFLDLLTKETATVLFLLLPFMAIIEKRIFSMKFLSKIFVLTLIIFIAFRFILPLGFIGLDHIVNSWVDRDLATAYKNTPDTGTITSTDLSIHKNILVELSFRAVTFPIKMVSQLFFPRQTVHSIVSFITPIIYPLPGESEELNRSQTRQFFMDGPGNDLLIYLLSICIFIFSFFLGRQFFKNKEIKKLQAIGTGIAIIIFSTLPLVLIVLSFPRWGYDTYFDSRHYYMPSVGAAILFPFFLFSTAEFFYKILARLVHLRIPQFFIVALLFLGWFYNSLHVFFINLNILVDVIGSPRRQIISQLKQQVPVLPQKAVFHVQTDGLGAYGPVLPFQTSIPQVLTVVYYDKNPLPDSFYNKFIFDAKPEGYTYANGRGFGYFATRRTLSDTLLANKFIINDIYSFYFDSQKTKLINTTASVRKEMRTFLQERKEINDWKLFQDPLVKLSFMYPSGMQPTDVPIASVEARILRNIQLDYAQFTASLKVMRMTQTVDPEEIVELFKEINDERFSSEDISSKKVFLDMYHSNDVLVITTETKRQYFMKFDEVLIVVTTPNTDETFLNTLEKTLGSVNVLKE